jgi:hypothetical protein
MSSAIKLRGLSMSEAEEAIAELWICLEEYSIPSPPKLKIFRTHNQITIEMSRFEEPLWTKFVDTHLRNWRRCTQPSGHKDRERVQHLETVAIGAIARN